MFGVRGHKRVRKWGPSENHKIGRPLKKAKMSVGNQLRLSDEVKATAASTVNGLASLNIGNREMAEVVEEICGVCVWSESYPIETAVWLGG